MFIVYELDTWLRDSNMDSTLRDFLFGAVKLAKNTNPEKYGNIGYGIVFDANSQFPLLIGEWGKNVVIFGVDNSPAKYVDNRKKISQLLVKDQQLDLMIPQ